MAAASAAFRGWLRRHKRVWKSWMAVAVTMWRIVRTEARLSPTRHRPLSREPGAHARGGIAARCTPGLPHSVGQTPSRSCARPWAFRTAEGRRHPLLRYKNLFCMAWHRLFSLLRYRMRWLMAVFATFYLFTWI